MKTIILSLTLLFVGVLSNAQITVVQNGNVSIGGTEAVTQLDVRGSLTLENGRNSYLYTGTGTEELNRYLFLLNSSQFGSASGLKTGGLLVADNYAFANPSKNDLVVKGKIGVGTAVPATELDVRGNLTLDNSGNPYVFTGTGTEELNRYLFLLNSPQFGSASGLKTGGLLVADNYSFANPSKNDLIVKGKTAIGTSVIGQHRLAVEGSIGAREVVVQNGAWADFVFETDYALPTLSEVAAHIKEKGHLKDIPSAIEVAENGISLGEMNAKLLQKIEELTLYTIAQEEKLHILQDALLSVQEEIKNLKK